MSNMKQKTDKSKAQASSVSKKTAAASTNKASIKRQNKAETMKEIQVPVPNGVEKSSRKRKADVAPNVAELKKQKSEELPTDHLPQSSDEEMDTMRGKRKSVTEVNSKRNLAKKTQQIPQVTKKSKVASKTAVKRQKVLLEVPTLPTVTGVLFVIGENDVGQLGFEESTALKKRPAEFTFPSQFVSIAAGGMHSVCLTNTGEVYTFGCNDEGVLGRPSGDGDIPEYAAGKINIPDVVVKVSAGDSHSAALTESGRVYIWGNFRSGDGPMGLCSQGVLCKIPVRILHNVTIVDIASGSEHFVCLSNDGEVYTCGCGENGQLGRISERSSKGSGRKGLVDLLEPQIVPLRQHGKPLAVSNIWTGSYSTFLKTLKTGDIYAFGLNNYSQLGLPFVIPENAQDQSCGRFKPVKIESFLTSLGWQRISGGQHHTLSLDNGGRVHSLGRKEYGRLGLGEDCSETPSPTLIPSLADIKCIDISSGNVASFSVAEDGSVYSWGFGTNYQLGHGNDEDSHVPKLIQGNFYDDWQAFRVSGGGQHTLILANRRVTPKGKAKK